MPEAAQEMESTEAPEEVAFEQVTEAVEEAVEEELVKSELGVFVPPDEIELASSGKKIPFPKMRWRLEAKILKVIGELVKEVPEIKNINFGDLRSKDFFTLASDLMIKAPQYVDRLILLAYPTLTEEDLDELEIADVADLLIPLSYAVAGDLFMLMGMMAGRTNMQ